MTVLSNSEGKEQTLYPHLVWVSCLLDPLDLSASASVHSPAVRGAVLAEGIVGSGPVHGFGVLRRWSWTLGVTLWAADVENAL